MVLKKKLDNPILKENSLYSDIENIKWFGVQRMGLAVRGDPDEQKKE